MKKTLICIVLLIGMSIATVILIKVCLTELKQNAKIENKAEYSFTKEINGASKGTSTKYYNIIELVNQYNGEVKQFKNTSNSLIEADIIIKGDEKKLSNFMGEFRKSKAVYDIKSICLNNESNDENNYSLEVDVEFLKK